MGSHVATATDSRFERYGPGEAVTHVLPGDFLLTHQDNWPARLIRFGQGLRFIGHDRTYARWNHTALFCDKQGGIIEALGTGVARQSIAKYQPTEYYVVRIQATAKDRAEAVHFAESCLNAPYGRLTIISVTFSLLTGARISFGQEGQFICSSLVARALERTTIVFPWDTEHMLPADLAEFFQVTPPAPGTPKGAIPRGLRGP